MTIPLPAEPVSVLFICTGNSCRSQMAEGFARALSFRAASAGTDPQGMNPYTARVMAEVGIDISDHYSKSVDDIDVAEFDHVITVCDHARESCPVLPGARHVLHHSFVDPAASDHLPDDEARLMVYRQVRDEIQAWVAGLQKRLN